MISHTRAVTMLLLFGLCWATTIPLIKIAVSTGHQPLGLILWQMIIAVLVLGSYVFYKRMPVPYDRQAIGYYAVIATLGTVLPNSFSYLAAFHLPAGIMAITLATVPMFALPVALIIRAESFNLFRFLGVVLGAVAVALLVWPDDSLPEPGKSIFVLLALVAPLCYALEGNYVAYKARQNIDPVTAVFGASLTGTVISFPVVVFGGFWVPLTLPWGPPEQSLVLTSLIHSVVYCGYLWLVNQTSAVFSSQISYIVTVGGVLASALFLGERYSEWVMAALGIMMMGLFLVQPKAPGK